jgi:iron complex outermembrane receptor protein
MMKKTVLLLFALLPLGSVILGQGRQVTGRVTDENGAPFAGVMVTVQGTRTAQISMADGRYAIQAPADGTLEFSFMGYETEAVTVGDRTVVDVAMRVSSTAIDDVVVIGYGTVRKDDMTGSVAVIRTEEINRGAVVSPQEMLKGKMPGVQIIPADGNPSSGATIRIRGAASLKATNNPLVVIDGVPIAENAGAGMANPMQSVNPGDIETISVLKDASAAAIYGSRASNGVIIITTKKGTGNEVRLAYNGSASVETNSGRLNVMRPGEFRDYVNKVYAPGSSEMADKLQALVGPESTEWQNLVFRTAVSNDHNVSAYGNVRDRMPWRASLGYTNQRGTLETSLYERGTVDVSLAPHFFDKHLTVSVNAKGAGSYQNNVDVGGVVGGAAFANPTVDPYFRNPDGSIDYTTANGFWNYGTGRGENFMPNTLLGSGPLSNLYDRVNHGTGKRLIGNTQIDYKVHGLEQLRLNLNLGLDWSSSKGTDGVRPNSFQAWTDTEDRGWGKSTRWTNLRRNKVLEAYANYNEQWGRHRLDVMGGYSWQHVYSSDHSPQYFNRTGELAKEASAYPYNYQESFLISFYGRVNYSFDSKYLLTFTLRDDASSRFAKDRRWGLFPSAALAWNIANEDFLRDVRAISALKLRVGAGQTGQQEFDNNYPYLARYEMSTNVYNQYNMGSGGYGFFLTPRAYDPSIRWETTTTYNVGIDVGLAGGRVNGSVDWYNRVTDDLLNEVMTPMGANFGNTLLTNIGSMRNTGLEFAVDFVPVATNDWNLEVGFNGTFQKTRFTKLNATDNENYMIAVTGISAGTGGEISRHKVGHAPFTYYTYQQVYDAEGRAVQNAFVDRDGDGAITQSDRYMTGKSPSPDFFYGLNMKLNYRQWDFGFNAHGSVGNWVFNDFASNHATSFVDVNAGNLPNFARTVLNTGWTGQNSSEQPFSDMFIEDASFFRMDDINLGYTFLKPFKGVGSVRLAFSVQNVFTLTGYSGVDPEIPGVDGKDSAIWPRPRTYSLRLNINF